MAGAMVSASTGAMTSLLAKLNALLSEEYTKLKSVRRKIFSVRDELSSMNALLVKLADVEGLDGQLKEWRNNVRELAYDMEDCIDAAFMHKLARGDTEQSGFIEKTLCKIKELRVRHKVANQIEELTARAKEVSERRTRYKLDESIVRTATPVPVDPRLPVILAESKGLIGVDGPRDTITGWLMD
ncbi:disease resistance protein PIK6-NP-like [Phragmites australis]|uniref:disease resistance protein PIK6-NP-like n=1 Tax=Phragmites australis TaxID=29695 RepID=UPI002D78068E|nr:disease resistance protein PIK6-NP-like [Phragmites australis]